MSQFTSELRVRLIPFRMFKSPSDFFSDRSKAALLLWIIFVINVSCFSLLYCLFGKADLLTLLYVMFHSVFVTFPYGA